MEETISGEPNDSGMKYIRVLPGANGLTMLGGIKSQAELVPFRSQHYFVLDEVDNLNDQAMKLLKSVMNIPGSVFILTTNNFDAVEVGVRSRCHCIQFNAAPEANWLPLVRRILTGEGVPGLSDKELLPVIG